MKKIVEPLLTKHKKKGFVFVQEKELCLQVRSAGGAQLHYEKVISFAESRAGNKYYNIPKSAEWILVIPAYLCTLKYTILPSVDPAELEKMLEFELPNIVSYNRRPWVWDFSIIGRSEDGSSKILIVLSPENLIDRYITALSSLGIKPGVITTSAIFYASMLSKAERLRGLSSWGFFYINNDYMDFVVTENQRVTFMRGVRLASEFGKNPGFIELEIGRSFSIIKEHTFADCPRKFFVINANSSVSFNAKAVQGILSAAVEQIEAGFVVRGLWFDSQFTNHGLDGTEKTRINLLPQDLKGKEFRHRKRRRLALHGLKAGLVLFLAFLCLRVSIWRKSWQLESYQKRLSEISPVAEKLQFLQQQLSIIENQLQGNVSMLEIIFELYKTLPKEITVHNLSIEQDGKIRIRAQAELLSQAFDCIGPLEQSDFFRNVRQNYAHQRLIGDSILIDFEIIADIQTRHHKPDKI